MEDEGEIDNKKVWALLLFLLRRQKKKLWSSSEYMERLFY